MSLSFPEGIQFTVFYVWQSKKLEVQTKMTGFLKLKGSYYIILLLLYLFFETSIAVILIRLFKKKLFLT